MKVNNVSLVNLAFGIDNGAISNKSVKSPITWEYMALGKFQFALAMESEFLEISCIDESIIEDELSIDHFS